MGLLDQIKSKAGARLRPGASLRDTEDALVSLGMAEAMVVALGLMGVVSNAEKLTAGLPKHDGDLDARLVPVALAREGFDGAWTRRTLKSLNASEAPALLLRERRQLCIFLGWAAPGIIRLRDGQGEQTLPLESLAAWSAVDVMVLGTADPVNGSEVADEAQAVQRNPRRWIISQFLANRKLLVQLCVSALLLNMAALVIPLYLRAVYDRVVPNLAIESLWALSLGVLIALVFEGVMKTVRSNFVDAIGLHIGQLVQHKAMVSILNARLGKAPTNSGMVATALRDIESMSVLLPNALVTFFIDLPFFLVFAALLWVIGGPVVAAAFFGGIGIAVIGTLANIGLNRVSRRATQLSQARSNLIVDTVEGLATLKAAQAQGRFLRAWDVLSDHSGLTARKSRIWLDTPVYGAAFLVQLVTVLVVIIGVFQVKAGALTVGGLVACTLLAGRAMVPVSNAVGILAKAYQGLTQFAGLSSLLALPTEPAASTNGVSLEMVKGGVRFSEASFAYDGQGKPAIDRLTLGIRPGERIALIGRNGSGKSTMLQMIAGLLSPTSGSLLIDDHNIEQFAASDLRQAVGYAAQDGMLFDISVRENVLLGDVKPARELFDAALDIAGVSQFTRSHPDGLGLPCGPRGSHLSGGQRQSVVLARALVRDPKVLLLDEPTAAMDIATEQQVISRLAELTAGKTLIIATHRLSLLQLVDRVIWLDDGRVTADRPRDEVMAQFARQSGNARAA